MASCDSKKGWFNEGLVLVSQLVLMGNCAKAVFVYSYQILVALRQKIEPGLTEGSVEDPAFSKYVTSGLLMTAAMFGFYATLTRKRTYMRLFAMILIVGVGVSGYVAYDTYAKRDEQVKHLEDLLRDSMPTYSWLSKDSPRNSLWDELQSSLECCGAHNMSEWTEQAESRMFGRDGFVPHSCCSKTLLTLTSGKCHSSWAYRVGCVDEYVELKKMVFSVRMMDTLYYMSLLMMAIGITLNSRSPSRQADRCARSQYDAYESSALYDLDYDSQGYSPTNAKPPSYVIAVAAPTATNKTATTPLISPSMKNSPDAETKPENQARHEDVEQCSVVQQI